MLWSVSIGRWERNSWGFYCQLFSDFIFITTLKCRINQPCRWQFYRWNEMVNHFFFKFSALHITQPSSTLWTGRFIMLIFQKFAIKINWHEPLRGAYFSAIHFITGPPLKSAEIYKVSSQIPNFFKLLFLPASGVDRYIRSPPEGV